MPGKAQAFLKKIERGAKEFLLLCESFDVNVPETFWASAATTTQNIVEPPLPSVAIQPTALQVVPLVLSLMTAKEMERKSFGKKQFFEFGLTFFFYLPFFPIF